MLWTHVLQLFVQLTTRLQGLTRVLQTSNGDTMQALDQALLASAHDVQRTASGLSFFSTAIRSPNPLNDVPSSRNMFERLYSLRTYRQSQTSRRSNRYSTGSAASTSSKTSADASEELYWESLHRILFVYAALSPLGYVQGMNEVRSRCKCCPERTDVERRWPPYFSSFLRTTRPMRVDSLRRTLSTACPYSSGTG
jgi:hypothetical protein